MGNSRWFLPPGRCLAIQILPSLQRSLRIPSPLLPLITYYFLSPHQPPSHRDSQYHRILRIVAHPPLLRVSQFGLPHQPVNFLRVEATSGASEPSFSGVSTLSLHLEMESSNLPRDQAGQSRVRPRPIAHTRIWAHYGGSVLLFKKI